MLLLGGAATVEALTGVNLYLASFLIPWGVILYTASGGLQATFLASYIHTVIIFAVLITMIFLVYIKVYSSDQIYDLLDNTVSYTEDQCAQIFSNQTSGVSFYERGTYACGPVEGNHDGSYLTMLSGGGLMFGIINIVGNFGTVFVDQSYWQSAIAARPSSAARGYLLGGYVSCFYFAFGSLSESNVCYFENLAINCLTAISSIFRLKQSLLVRHPVLPRDLARTGIYGPHAPYHRDRSW